MRIAKLSLICLVAFAFMVGCGMIGKKAEMSETAATSMEGAAMESEAKTDMAGDMEQAAVEEVTLNVTGMT
ncbi:hypothetical protein F4Y59_01705 [Candidatus Poribacteria bacterium]|nr:hypothetical protein [Candidatus Poribacteria bacterium]MDE2800382.1 hypothetical protein [Gemmatimonadota bacterium]MXY26860.1 hypothetical protein [Candidatus Poribacteria bacterium]